MGAALLEIGFDVEAASADVERDDVAIAQESDGTSSGGFGSDVADHQAVRRAAEAAVGDERDFFVNALTDQSAGDGEHFAHPGPPLGPS